ncbi:thiolase C-terminal domain-containing protein [Rhodococcus qingshengii]|uniref:thiolase C-terminal domain-containing protein n=1 Tax=Rhodococcus qingshengii TaxID=334542 RepID=UPI0036DF4C79
MLNVYVLGVATAPASRRRDDVRLEELVYDTAKRALDDAQVTQAALDSVTLGSSDELDGRPISSMLMASPAGGFQTDEIKVSDSGLTALCLAAARHASGDFDLGMVSSWCKPSKADVPVVMNSRADPFYLRDLGVDDLMTDALFAQAVADEFGIDDAELAERAAAGRRRAARNPRGLGSEVSVGDLGGYLATPIREAHRAETTDGAASLVLASERWLARHPDKRPIARLAGVGWSNDSYSLDRERLRGLKSARSAWNSALRMAGGDTRPDVIEFESPTVFHEAAYERALDVGDAAISPSGGVYAQNPLAATGLVHAVEAVLQVSDRAEGVQVPGARRAVAHSCHGFAQQGNVFAVFDRTGEN